MPNLPRSSPPGLFGVARSAVRYLLIATCVWLVSGGVAAASADPSALLERAQRTLLAAGEVSAEEFGTKLSESLATFREGAQAIAESGLPSTRDDVHRVHKPISDIVELLNGILSAEMKDGGTCFVPLLFSQEAPDSRCRTVRKVPPYLLRAADLEAALRIHSNQLSLLAQLEGNRSLAPMRDWLRGGVLPTEQAVLRQIRDVAAYTKYEWSRSDNIVLEHSRGMTKVLDWLATRQQELDAFRDRLSHARIAVLTAAGVLIATVAVATFWLFRRRGPAPRGRRL